jgi:hypothetical protein
VPLPKSSTPELNFPARNNAELAPMLQFTGATVDGVAHSVWPSLTGTDSQSRV